MVENDVAKAHLFVKLWVVLCKLFFLRLEGFHTCSDLGGKKIIDFFLSKGYLVSSILLINNHIYLLCCAYRVVENIQLQCDASFARP